MKINAVTKGDYMNALDKMKVIGVIAVIILGVAACGSQVMVSSHTVLTVIQK